MLGKRIAEQRKKLGLSQEELAEKLNISQKSISKYELGDRKPQYKVLVRMAEYFGVTTDYLLELDGDGNAMLGKRIAELRKACDMSQKELGEKLGLSASAIGMYEQGRRDPSNAMLIGMEKLFGVTVDYLLGSEDLGRASITDCGSIIKELRKEAGMTQEELGEKLGVIKQTVSSWEKGISEVSNDTLITLSRLFGVTTDYLLGLEGRDSMEIKEKSNEIVHRIGQNIKNLRERKGMTQKELAAALGITRSALSTYEVGIREPNHATTIAIAKLFNVTLDELVMKELTPPIPMYARNLAYLRRKHGMTQADVANLLGVSKATSCKYENGDVEPNVEQLIKLAEFFGVTMDQIIKQDLSQEVSEWKQ
nr:MAG TPA: Repressor protein CI [Caudoviricetes sp.]